MLHIEPGRDGKGWAEGTGINEMDGGAAKAVGAHRTAILVTRGGGAVAVAMIVVLCGGGCVAVG